MDVMLTLAEAARIARVSTDTLKRLAPTTGLRLLQVSERKIIISETDFQAWMRERERPQVRA